MFIMIGIGYVIDDYFVWGVFFVMVFFVVMFIGGCVGFMFCGIKIFCF